VTRSGTAASTVVSASRIQRRHQLERASRFAQGEIDDRQEGCGLVPLAVIERDRGHGAAFEAQQQPMKIEIAAPDRDRAAGRVNAWNACVTRPRSRWNWVKLISRSCTIKAIACGRSAA